MSYYICNFASKLDRSKNPFDQEFKKGQSTNSFNPFKPSKASLSTGNLMTDSKERNNRKELIGVVRSRSGDKSIKVVYEYRYLTALQEIRLHYAHDEENNTAIGDKVRIMATRPLSKLKRWRVVEVVEKAPVI